MTVVDVVVVVVVLSCIRPVQDKVFIAGGTTDLLRCCSISLQSVCPQLSHTLSKKMKHHRRLKSVEKPYLHDAELFMDCGAARGAHSF